MGYIIVWRNSHREPFVDVNSSSFKEEYYSYDSAKQAAEEILRTENENDKSPWYFDYQIYEEVNS